jgi:hypothetical protein
MELITLDGSDIQAPIEDVKVKKITIFDFANDICEGKKNLLSDATEKEFVPFMINRALSQHLDTVMLANELNKMSISDKLMAHDFLFYAVSKKKRYGKWAKATTEDNDNLELLMKHYAINRKVAMQYLQLMTDDQMNELKQRYETGGRTK